MTACAYNGCTGTIEDGYCSVCGLAPAKQGPSAAAPQGSGLAALWLCRHPDWTPDRVRAELRTDAFDLGPRGHDWETGYGLIHLPRE